MLVGQNRPWLGRRDKTEVRGCWSPRPLARRNAPTSAHDQPSSPAHPCCSEQTKQDRVPTDFETPRSIASQAMTPTTPARTGPLRPDPTDLLAADRFEATVAKGCALPPPMRPSAPLGRTQAADESAAQTGCAGSQRVGLVDLIPNWDALKCAKTRKRSAFPLVRAGVVGLPGLEPGTSSLSGMRSNRLSYRPVLCWGNVAQGFGAIRCVTCGCGLGTRR